MYVFIAEVRTNHGIVTYFLANDDKWYRATNNAKKFHSVDFARMWWQNNKYSLEDSYLPVGTNVWIQGPRGGLYYTNR